MDIHDSQTHNANSKHIGLINSHMNWFESNESKIHNPLHLLLKYLGEHWTLNIVLSFIFYYILAVTAYPELKIHDETAISGQDNVRYSIKGSLIYCLGWIVILTVHEQYANDYMRVLKADNREGYKRIVILSFKFGVFYALALQLPANHYANRLLAILTLYIWLSQKYIRTVIHYNYHSITKKKMQFVNNFSMNQATSLVFIVSPLSAALIPQLPWFPGFITLFPILCRFTQCFIVGTHQQYLNSIKFTLNLIGFGYSVVGMPVHSHNWRIAAAIYSFYWDVFRDWKWKIRFYEKKDYRIDLPFLYFILGFLYDLLGRTIWIIIPMNTQERGIIQMTRRLAWNMLRIEREQVFYFPKPQNNKLLIFYKINQLYSHAIQLIKSIQSTIEMEVEQIKFDKELYRFLNMAIEIWPSFKSGMKHLSQIQQLSSESFLPKKNYSTMTQDQFAQTITNDLFQFIMEHDVSEEDIQDYLYDILDLLMIDEQLSGAYKNPASVQYMGNYTMRVIKQLQDGKNDLIVAFENDIYLNVKQFKGEIVQSKQNNSESDDQCEQEYQSDEEQEEGFQQKEQKKEVKKKSEQQLKKQEELEDDGWIIVRK